MLPAKVDTITFDESSHMGIIVLAVKDMAVPIWVGLFEAQSILLKLQGTPFPRPLTHDLLRNSIQKLSGKLEYVYINDIKDGTFYAQIHLKQDGKKKVIDSRPSDAIALAVRADIPIYVDEKVYRTSRVDKKELMKEQKEKMYKAYLESLGDDEIGKLKH